MKTQSGPDLINVAPWLRILDMQFVASVIDCNTYRLGYIVLAKVQQSNELTIPLSWAEAHQTAVVVDKVPASGFTSSDPEEFARSVTLLQAACGIYSHSNRAYVNRAKDRFTNFACDLSGTAINPYPIMAQDAPVFFQLRPALLDEVYAEAQSAITKRLWICKFAHISTVDVEAMQ